MNRRKFFRRLGAVAVGSAVAPAVVIKVLSPIATKYKMGVDVGLGRDIAVTTIYPRDTPFLDMVRHTSRQSGKYSFNWIDDLELKKDLIKKSMSDDIQYQVYFGPGSHKK